MYKYRLLYKGIGIILWSPENGSGIFAFDQASRVIILLQEVEDYDFTELCLFFFKSIRQVFNFRKLLIMVFIRRMWLYH